MRKIKQTIKDISPLNNREEMPKAMYVIKVILIFWFVLFAAELIAEGVVLAAHYAAGKDPLKGEMFGNNTIMLLTYYGYGIMLAVIVLYWKLFQKKKLSAMGLTRRFGSYIVGMAVGAVLVALSAAAVVMTGAIEYNGIIENIDYTFIILMFGGFILQGAMEEFLCRGIVLHLLKDRISVPVAVGVGTALFVIPHIPSMTGAGPATAAAAIVNTSLISLIFSILVLRYKNIWAACGMHSIWNFILYNVMGLDLSGQDAKTAAVFDMSTSGSNIINGGMYGIEASVVTTVILAAALGLCFALYRREIRAELNNDTKSATVSVSA